MPKDQQRLYDRLKQIMEQNPYDPNDEYHVWVPIQQRQSR